MTISSEDEELPKSQIERAKLLENMLIGQATGGSLDEPIYLELRTEFMNDANVKDILPSFIRTNRNAHSLWGYFQRVSSKWSDRRIHISKEFTPLLDYLENRNRNPADDSITETLASFDSEGVHNAWAKALERREVDPEGAITTARTLLETVCKGILDEGENPYTNNDDLPKLYQKTASQLTLAPSQHSEEVFRAILGSCQQVVNSLGTLRNRIGDAHGQGKKQIRPSARHATLAVNLAGSMATFLIETWLSKKETENK